MAQTSTMTNGAAGNTSCPKGVAPNSATSNGSLSNNVTGAAGQPGPTGATGSTVPGGT